MLENILINEYKKLLKDIINEYINIVNKDNFFYKYLKIINHEIKLITDAFETLVNQRKDTFKSIFEYDFESILYAVDKDFFNTIKSIFKNVSLLLIKK